MRDKTEAGKIVTRWARDENSDWLTFSRAALKRKVAGLLKRERSKIRKRGRS